MKFFFKYYVSLILIINKKKRYLRGDSYLFHLKREYEPGLNSVIQKISSFCDKEIVLDIGANIGMTAIIFSDLFEKVIAFGMSGSGSSCFGIFKNAQDLIYDKEFIKLKSKNNYFIWHGNKKEFGYNRFLY